MVPSTLLAALLAAIFASPRELRDAPSLKDVLGRLGAYVASYGEKASVVVATERYSQEVMSARRPTIRRVMVADFAIVKTEGPAGWVGFRDVLEVDGRPVADRNDRLLKLVTDAGGSADEARRLSDESARFNIGPILRNFNVPTTTLFFFTTANADRFRFKRKAIAADGTWEIDFRETGRPTLVRTPEGTSIPCEGTLWVRAADGAVVRTLIRMSDFAPRGSGAARGAAVIDVTYARVEPLAMWLPATMTEAYDGTRGLEWDRLVTRAQYSGYRQFQTAIRIK